MNFPDMQAKLLTGKKLRRGLWLLDTHIEFVAKSATNPKDYIKLVLKGKNGPFAAQSDDILATDWETVA